MTPSPQQEPKPTGHERATQAYTEVAKINRHLFAWNFSADTLSTPLNATLTLLEAPKYSWKAYTSSLKNASHRRFIFATSVRCSRDVERQRLRHSYFYYNIQIIEDISEIITDHRKRSALDRPHRLVARAPAMTGEAEKRKS